MHRQQCLSQNPEVSQHFSTSGSIVPDSMGFSKGILVKSVDHTSSRYSHVLFYDIKHTSYTTLVIFFKLMFFNFVILE